MTTAHRIDWYTPEAEHEAKVNAAWRDADEWAALAKRHRRDAHKYWRLVFWRDGTHFFGTLRRTVGDLDRSAFGLVLLCVQWREYAVREMRKAVARAIELETKGTP